ncbi:MAG: ABC transporter substrate-binding protein [Pseudomonadota bacterium]
MKSDISRRVALTVLAGAAGLVALPAGAITDAKARQLVNQVVADINSIINSGRSERAMFGEFEKVFRRYGDVPIIARSALGPDARSASRAQLNAFADAFAIYLSRKYGRRFREFIGGQIEVTGTRQVRDYFEVVAVTRLRGQSPFEVVFRVSDKSGKDKFFDIVIEGISLLKTERTEIGALLDQRRRDLDRLIADLPSVGV